MFSAPLLEGIWTSEGSEHYVNIPSQGRVRVHEALANLVNQEVQVAFHHLPVPPTPLDDPSLWINLKASGVLSLDPETGIYSVLGFDGSKTTLDFSSVNGHAARFLGVTTAVAIQMRQTVEEAGVANMVEDLTYQLDNLKSLVEKLSPVDK